MFRRTNFSIRLWKLFDDEDEDDDDDGVGDDDDAMGVDDDEDEGTSATADMCCNICCLLEDDDDVANWCKDEDLLIAFSYPLFLDDGIDDKDSVFIDEGEKA